ncbi:hypothetical protein Btru_005957 [Bulinus truncatus]|nr:hypothetical protein Btru_005957 [Bulinus truncatus]
MSAITSNTIVITAYPGKHGTINMSRNAEYSLLDPVDFDSDDSNSSGAGAPKKRRRLTHLSPDEKLLRRKLKNRVAAQTARDRKKALMAELEEKVAKLEEENKILKRQNFTLKETSSTLAKENAALKSRLSESPLSTIKTESATSRSAAPAVPLQKEQVQILSRWMVQYFTLPDDLLCLLQELTEDEQRECTKTQAATPLSQGICGTDCTDSGNRTDNRTSLPRVVGLSSAELESLNELIQIDHVYVKPQPLKQIGGKEGQQKPTTAVIKQDANGSVAPQQNKQFIVLSGLKRNHDGGSINHKSPSVQSSPSMTVDIAETDSELSVTSAATELPVLTSFSSQIDFQNDSDDIISTLSDSDMETSLQLFQNFDLDLIDSNNQHEINKPVPNIDYSFLNCSKSDSKQNGDIELNSTKLFDEIYEHYLSIRESSASPSSAALSDSGISSDTEPLSPHSLDEESFHDQLLWQDTSFTDLFPDLQ